MAPPSPNATVFPPSIRQDACLASGPGSARRLLDSPRPRLYHKRLQLPEHSSLITDKIIEHFLARKSIPIRSRGSTRPPRGGISMSEKRRARRAGFFLLRLLWLTAACGVPNPSV